MRQKTWKDFIQESLKAFSSEQPDEKMRNALAFQNFYAEVFRRRLDLTNAFSCLCDEQFIAGLKSDITNTATDSADDFAIENGRLLALIASGVSSVAEAAEIIKQQNANLSQQVQINQDELKEEIHPRKALALESWHKCSSRCGILWTWINF